MRALIIVAAGIVAVVGALAWWRWRRAVSQALAAERVELQRIHHVLGLILAELQRRGGP